MKLKFFQLEKSAFPLQKLLSFPGVELKPHFDKTSMRLKNKIWITWKEGDDTICLKLSPEDQQVFTRIGKDVVYPVPNAWGRQGWTYVNCHNVMPDMLTDILIQSFLCLDAKGDANLLLSLITTNEEPKI